MDPTHPVRHALFVALLVGTAACALQEGLLERSLAGAPHAEEGPPRPAEAAAADSADHRRALVDAALLRNLNKLPVLPPEKVDTETLWLARCIYSETKKPLEQKLVAWVVRNRVETGYRGNHTYRTVVLDPYQFSAFNLESPLRSYFLSLDERSRAPGWQQALRIAYDVRHARPLYRPFSIETRHFFSERSMVGRSYPTWAERQKLVVALHEVYGIDKRRFRFYRGIS